MRKYLILLFVISFQLQADVYKWLDENGRVHYGDRPASVKQADDQRMDIKLDRQVVKSLPGDRREKRKKLLDAIDEDRQLRKQQVEKEKKKRAELAKQCHQAKDSLKSYQRSRSVYNLDKEGNRVTLPSSARDKMIVDLKAKIDRHCK
ncbi:MAG: DUF4124 domain-containing protein [Gammaproteobacteria bacterium]|nr:DUF4124 domain-containing protein [Gammaproteobacteria bacterium]